MKQETAFDRLVRTLSSEERQLMLDRIRSIEVKDNAPLIVDDSSETYDSREDFARLGFWARLIIFIKSLFSGTDRYEIVEESAIQRLAKELEHSAPSLLSYQDGELGHGFYDRIVALEGALAFLKQPLKNALGGEKEDFVAFYGGWSMPVLQQQLMDLLDPRRIAFERSIEKPMDVKRIVELLFDDLMDGIDDMERKKLYQQARSLTILRKLVDFPYTKLTAPFLYSSSGPAPAGMNEVRVPLFEFNTVLHSLEPLPDEETLKTFFMFDMQKELEEREFNAAEQLVNLMDRLSRAFALIRDLFKGMRINDLCKIMSRNLNYQPGSISGGEDWFRIYRKFWEKRIDKVLGRFVEEEKRNQIITEAAKYLKRNELPLLDYYRSGSLPMEVQPRFSISLSFIRAFVKDLYLQELHSPLKLVLIDGQFYKDQNREDYNESYSGILKVIDEIKYIDSALSPEGAVRRSIDQIAKEMAVMKVLRRKIEGKIGELDREAERIIVAFQDNLRRLTDVLGGIVEGDMGGRFDTLSNLGYIGKNDNKNLLKRLRSIREVLEKTLVISRDLFDIERNLEYE
jgi:hypothetical protein